jgi:hypothetical protein
MSNANITLLGYLAPEYASIDADRFNAIKPIAECYVDPEVFGVKEDYAVTYIIAHILTMSDRINSGKKDSELSQTSYGTEFLRLRKITVFSPIIWT